MRNKNGQAVMEMVFILPLFLMLAAGVCALVYMCWQGITVQQAANLAARIQGQERVAGGVSLSSIQQDNGVAAGGDTDPTTVGNLQSGQAGLSQHPAPTGTVYGKLQRAAKSMFGLSEQSSIYVPEPHYGTVGITDEVKVVRIWDPPKIFNMDLNPVMLVGKAYGGEDPHMYGLVRWGSTAYNGSQKFWAQKGSNGRPENLPNPNGD